jgi:hypothetical protein
LYDEIFSSKFCNGGLEFFVYSQEAGIEKEEERDKSEKARKWKEKLKERVWTYRTWLF